MTVVPRGPAARKARRVFTVDRELSPPPLRVPRDSNVFMMGIGGTGGGTVKQVLRTAALPYGQHVRGPDPTGLSPKGGPPRSPPQNFQPGPEGMNNGGAGTAA